MTSSNLDKLPPEMQARIAQLLSQATPPESPHQAAIAPSAPEPPEPITRTPSLMDHTIALRQEVAQLSSQVAAMGQVTEAVGQAVGELYQLFRAQTATTDYSAAYQAHQELDSDY
tara:strand:- start:8409 stop:8753 length:345 start_codon:yes stop_codon:yes gene_type:complete